MNGESFFFIHPYAYQIILVCSGFALVFRLNLSHARYWEARTAVQNCSAKWLDGAMMALSFDDDEGFAARWRRRRQDDDKDQALASGRAPGEWGGVLSLGGLEFLVS